VISSRADESKSHVSQSKSAVFMSAVMRTAPGVSSAAITCASTSVKVWLIIQVCRFSAIACGL
jgi:hypothetical protein